MSGGEYAILVVMIVLIAFLVIVIIRESIKYKKSVNDVSENKEDFICYEGVVISKKVVGIRTEGLNLPKTIIEYGVYFLLNNGEEKLYLLPENVFDQLKEGIKGNLYIKNNAYFDFEEIE